MSQTGPRDGWVVLEVVFGGTRAWRHSASGYEVRPGPGVLPWSIYPPGSDEPLDQRHGYRGDAMEAVERLHTGGNL